jgi:hypothetical protein
LRRWGNVIVTRACTPDWRASSESSSNAPTGSVSINGSSTLVLEFDLRNLVRENATIGEELPQVDGHVRPREERPQRRLGNLAECLVGGDADLGIAILEQQHEDRELLVGARGERARRRLHADVAVHLASFEQVQQRGRGSHQRT